MNDETLKPVKALKLTWRGKVFEMSVQNPLGETILATGKARVVPFSTAVFANAVLLFLLWLAGVLVPPSLRDVKQSLITNLVNPLPVHASKPIKPRRAAPPIAEPSLAEKEPILTRPAIPIPVPVAPVLKVATRAKTAAPDNDLMSSSPHPVDPSLGSSAIPNLKKPREEVQTGGFGDPNGVPSNGNKDRSPNVEQLGSYDLPSGPGNGNGPGGRRGASGVVASAGFGDGVATAGKQTRTGAVQQGLFASERAGTNVPKVKQVAESPRSTPVEILFKPKPTYTDYARANNIEGEVLLEVTFTASGQVNVGRVVQALGYGLEDAAEAAARQIRFKPAQQDGVPVDSTAIVHITFELAS